MDNAENLASEAPLPDSGCAHLDQVQVVDDTRQGCQECLELGMVWVHLRQCLSCGHVGCCNSSQGRHALWHFQETGHAVVRSREPGETWRWCWVDEVVL